MQLENLDFAQPTVIHSNEMEASLIIGDQKSRKVAGGLPKDLEDRIGGVAGKRGMRLTVAFDNIRDREMSHTPVLPIADVFEYSMASR
jgi:hypothetical protein